MRNQRTIVLVSCVAKKRPGRHQAKDLYDSPWFCKARAYAEQEGDAWYILSAKHGLLSPQKMIKKYDETLSKYKKKRAEWGKRVLADLRPILGPRDCVILVAFKAYAEAIKEGLMSLSGCVKTPLTGKGIGEQEHWLLTSVRHSE